MPSTYGLKVSMIWGNRWPCSWDSKKWIPIIVEHCEFHPTTLFTGNNSRARFEVTQLLDRGKDPLGCVRI